MTTSGKEWQRVAASDTSSDNEWQQMTTNDNKWYNKWQRIVQQETTGDNEWQWVTTSDNEWQRVVILAYFPFFRIRVEPTTIHPKETP